MEPQLLHHGHGAHLGQDDNPHIWIDTEYNSAYVAWWGNTAAAPLPDGVAQQINAFVSQTILQSI